jgi:uncharacterized protein (TIGR03067 family)
MKNILTISVALGLALMTFAADPPEDAKAIQGVWIAAKGELGAQPMQDAFLKTITLKLTPGEYERTVEGKPERDHGTLTLDTASTPKGMTITSAEGPNKGKTFPAIYELKDDTLCICYDLSGAKRPTEFKTSAGTRLYLVTYQRKK